MEEWESLRLIEILPTEDDPARYWRCPVCGENIIFMLDGGELDFGTVGPIEGPTDFLETFENVAHVHTRVETWEG